MAKSFLKLVLLFALLLPGDADAATKKKAKTTSRSAVTKITRPASKSAAVAKPKAPAAPALAPDGELSLRARGAIVIDAFTGETLYEKNADTAEFPASTTKIMTALLVIESGDLDREVEIDLEDSKVGESGLDIKPGEHFTRRQMLYGLMLKSANDVAHALARDNAGSVEAFAEKMTRRAAELGAISTRFMNPHGLHHRLHYTTARDLALIARAAMAQPFFRELVQTRKHPWVTEVAVRELFNHNRLLTRFPGCTGVKTGYTNPAQQVLVSAARRETREVIAVVMHTDKPGIWDDSTALLNFGFEHPPTSAAVAISRN